MFFYFEYKYLNNYSWQVDNQNNSQSLTSRTRWCCNRLPHSPGCFPLHYLICTSPECAPVKVNHVDVRVGICRQGSLLPGRKWWLLMLLMTRAVMFCTPSSSDLNVQSKCTFSISDLTYVTTPCLDGKLHEWCRTQALLLLGWAALLSHCGLLE